jgi:hypothetical protein
LLGRLLRKSKRPKKEQEEMATLLTAANAAELRVILRSVSFPMLLYAIALRLVRLDRL